MGAAIRIDELGNGYAALTFDCPGEKINALSAAVLEELESTLLVLRSKTLDALFILSAKPDIFIAGADISEIQAIKDVEDAEEKAKRGQAVLNLITELPFPTIAVIDGACLGGGTELALACSYRVATDHPKTQIGLPEVNLGIIPGFGGTQRLPRLIGLSRSLPLILTGKPVDANKALKLGLVDAVFDREFLSEKTKNFAQQLLSDTKKIKTQRKRYSLVMKWIEAGSLGRKILIMLAKREAMKQSKGHYPAPLAALSVLQKTANLPVQKGLNIEAKAFSQLATTPICRSLVHLFFVQEALKKDTGVPDKTPGTIAYAGVLGAGLMGGGIAWALSQHNISVRLKDLKWEALTHGIQAAQTIYKDLVKKRKLMRHEMGLKMAKISPTTSYLGFRRLDIVIEAVIEDVTIKQKVYRELENEIRETTIIASNTSALDIDELASSLSHPQRFIGMHFFSPVNRMPLVEVIRGQYTSDETVSTVVQLAKTMKKTPIVVKNCPGFLVNRILIPYVSEAVNLVQEGVPITRIDAIAEKFGMPIGPLALADEVGLDVGYKVAKILEAGYGERMKVMPGLEWIHTQGLLGKKGKAGFYLYHDKKRSENPLIQSIAQSKIRISDDIILDRLMLIMVNEAYRCLSEGIVKNADYLDMAMILGTGFPPFRGGLIRYAQQRGESQIKERLAAFSNQYGQRFNPAVFT